MNESIVELLGWYGFKNLAFDEAIERRTLLVLILESTNVEVAMHIIDTGLKCPSDYSILLQPNVFMGNTSASVTTMKNNMSTKNVQWESTTKMVGVHGGSQATTSAINVTGTMCDRNGHEYMKAKLKDVWYNPMINFNLFIIAKAMLH